MKDPHNSPASPDFISFLTCPAMLLLTFMVPVLSLVPTSDFEQKAHPFTTPLSLASVSWVPSDPLMWYFSPTGHLSSPMKEQPCCALMVVQMELILSILVSTTTLSVNKAGIC